MPVCVSLKVTVTLEQISVAIAVPKIGVSPHAKGALAGMEVKVGGVVSGNLTIVWKASILFPQPSKIIKRLVYSIPLHMLPTLSFIYDTVTEEQSSEAVGCMKIGVSWQEIE